MRFLLYPPLLLLACTTAPEDYRLNYGAVWDHTVAAYRDARGPLKAECRGAWREIVLWEQPAGDCDGTHAVGCTRHNTKSNSGGPWSVWVASDISDDNRCDIAVHEFLHVILYCQAGDLTHDDKQVWYREPGTIIVDAQSRSLADCLEPTELSSAHNP